MSPFFKRHCIICAKDFYVRINGFVRTKKTIRSKRGYTCSKKCSRVYMRQRDIIKKYCKRKNEKTYNSVKGGEK